MEYNAINELLMTSESGVLDHYTKNINGKKVLDIKFQTGGTATTEKNGVFIEDLIAVTYAKLKEYNDSMPSRENSIALTKLEEAAMWLQRRKQDRERRGVYGTEEK